MSTSGQPYTALPNAFKYRKEFTPACSCRRQGQSWADALINWEESMKAKGSLDLLDLSSHHSKPTHITPDFVQRVRRNGASLGRPQRREPIWRLAQLWLETADPEPGQR